MSIVEQLIPKDSGRVLDVGCGNINVGGHMYCFNRLKANYKVIGIDVSPGKRENVLKASAQRLPFADKSIDYVVSFDVIEHVEDFSSVIKDMLRVAKRRVIIIVPTTTKKIVRNVVNFIRRMLGGAGSKYGEFFLQGHYYEFFPKEILFFKGKGFTVKFYKMNFPLIGQSFLHRTGMLYAGIYVFDRIKTET